MPLQGDAGTHTERAAREQELGQIAKGAPAGIEAGPIDGDNMLAWQATIKGDVRPAPPRPFSLALPFRPLAAPSAAARRSG